MAATQTTTSTATADERAAIEPFALQLLELARRTDAAATYTLAPPIDPGIWVMHLYLRGDLVDDPDLSEALAERTTDILIEHNVGIATLF
ncbi:MAG: hypothetical protein HY332_05010, partial [Chloroflexi bacterium]|nr:hypothetical protein [Chloroflexota bacterium]